MKRRSKKLRPDYYQIVTDQIIAELESGTAPWIKPWSTTPGFNVPMNAVSKHKYQGINQLLLFLTIGRGWRYPHFLTFKQCTELGGKVIKGEKHTKTFFFKPLEVQDKDAPEDDATKIIPLIRANAVFNIDQCEGLPDRIASPESKVTNRQINPDEPDDLAEQYLAATGATIKRGTDAAAYSPSHDHIMLPAFDKFLNAHTYYATAFHELGHWTGHETRLNRDKGMKSRFKSSAYAAEELIAELASAFQCAEFSFDGETRHAGYIGTWLKLLKDDKRAIFTAASKAQAAVDFLRTLALTDSNPKAKEAAQNGTLPGPEQTPNRQIRRHVSASRHMKG
jgi:antirestriction protein ArdC